MSDKCPNHVRRRRGCPICERISAALAESAFAPASLLECSFGIRADNPNWRCHAAAKWSNWYNGHQTKLYWCDEHKPDECIYPHELRAL